MSTDLPLAIRGLSLNLPGDRTFFQNYIEAMSGLNYNILAKPVFSKDHIAFAPPDFRIDSVLSGDEEIGEYSGVVSADTCSIEPKNMLIKPNEVLQAASGYVQITRFSEGILLKSLGFSADHIQVLGGSNGNFESCFRKFLNQEQVRNQLVHALGRQLSGLHHLIYGAGGEVVEWNEVFQSMPFSEDDNEADYDINLAEEPSLVNSLSNLQNEFLSLIKRARNLTSQSSLEFPQGITSGVIEYFRPWIIQPS